MDLNDPACDRCLGLKHVCEKWGEGVSGCKRCTVSKVGCGLITRKKARVGDGKEAKEVRGTRGGGGVSAGVVGEVRGLREDMGEIVKKVGDLAEKLGDIAGVAKLWWLREEAREIAVMCSLRTRWCSQIKTNTHPNT